MNGIYAYDVVTSALVCWLLLIMSLLAAIFEYACLREPKIKETKLSAIARRITIVGWIALSVRMIWLLTAGSTTVSLLGAMAVTTIALGRILRCVNEIDLTQFVPPPSAERRRHTLG